MKKAPENQTPVQDAPPKLKSASASGETVFMPPANTSISDSAGKCNRQATGNEE